MMTETMNMRSGGEAYPYGWWFDSRDTCCVACSPWLLSSLQELNEKTQAMLRLIEEEADTFTQRVEMYYQKRPQLISLVEDFYRAQRSLFERFDHLGHNVGSRGKDLDPHELAYGSEVDDDPEPQGCYEAEELGNELKHERLMSEIEKLVEERMVRDQQLAEKESEITKLVQEIEKLRVESKEMDVIRKSKMMVRMEMETEMEKMKAENEVLSNELARETMKAMETKDEEKREAIRQLSVAVEALKGENVVLKKWIIASKRGRPFDLQVLKDCGWCT